MSDVLEALAPIGAARPTDPDPELPLPRPSGAPSLSDRERRLHRRAAAISGHANPHVIVSRAGKSIRWAKQYREPVSGREAAAMVDTLLRDLYDTVQEERGRHDRAASVKNLTAAVAIAIDKKHLLAASAALAPGQNPADLRPGLRELVRRLAGLERDQPPTAATNPQP